MAAQLIPQVDRSVAGEPSGSYDPYFLNSFECLFYMRDYRLYPYTSRSVEGDRPPYLGQPICADLQISMGTGTIFWFGQTFYDYDYRANDVDQFASFRSMIETALLTPVDCELVDVSTDPPVIGKGKDSDTTCVIALGCILTVDSAGHGQS